uniref:EF-hand domain-containing protein n=1 Tax=Plectus sambesii TaxID=2011161 RepID=A0A914XGN6_9BILA
MTHVNGNLFARRKLEVQQQTPAVGSFDNNSFESVGTFSSESSYPEPSIFPTSFESNRSDHTDDSQGRKKISELKNDSGYKSQSTEQQYQQQQHRQSSITHSQPHNLGSEASNQRSYEVSREKRRNDAFFQELGDTDSAGISGESFDDGNTSKMSVTGMPPPLNGIQPVRRGYDVGIGGYYRQSFTRDYSIDNKTDNTFREFLRFDPKLEPDIPGWKRNGTRLGSSRHHTIDCEPSGKGKDQMFAKRSGFIARMGESQDSPLTYQHPIPVIRLPDEQEVELRLAEYFWLCRQFRAAPRVGCGCLDGLLKRVYWIGRRLQFWLCYYHDDFDIDVEDLLQNPFNTQPPSLTDLARATGFNRHWLTFVYRNFKQHCPNGRMTAAQWKKIFSSIIPTGADYSFADRMFKSMDPCQAGCVTFEDLILCVFDLSTDLNVDGGVAADFAFSLMDPDCQGRLDKRQFVAYAQTVFDLNGLTKDCGYFVERQFGRQEVALDEDEDGYITVLDIERIFKQSHIVNSSWFIFKKEGSVEEQSRPAPIGIVSSVGRGRNRAKTLVKAEKRRAIYSTQLTKLPKPPPVLV